MADEPTKVIDASGGGGKPVEGETLHHLKVDGKELTMTDAELVTAMKAAELEGGAANRMREASETKKEYEALLEDAQVGAELKHLNDTVMAGTGTEMEIDRYCVLMNLGEDGKAVLMGKETPVVAPTTPTTPAGPAAPAAGGKMGFSDLTPEMQQVMIESYNLVREQKDVSQRENIVNLIDSDTDFGKMTESLDANKKAEYVSSVMKLVESEVDSRLRRGTQAGPKLVPTAVKAVLGTVTKFGIPGKKDDTLVPGFGPTGGQYLSDVQVDEPIPRVPLSDDNWMENTIKRAQQLAFRTAKQKDSHKTR